MPSHTYVCEVRTIALDTRPSEWTIVHYSDDLTDAIRAIANFTPQVVEPSFGDGDNVLSIIWSAGGRDPETNAVNRSLRIRRFEEVYA
jgi:glycyl-tRNA synthetase (class II)